MAYKNYLVVEFTSSEDREASVMPKEWLINSQLCYWPKYRKGEQYKLVKAIKVGFEPEETWEKHSIQILKQTDDYDKAELYLERLEDESTCETDCTEAEDAAYVPGKRVIRPNRKYQDFGYDDVAEKSKGTKSLGYPQDKKNRRPVIQDLESDSNDEDVSEEFHLKDVPAFPSLKQVSHVSNSPVRSVSPGNSRMFSPQRSNQRVFSTPRHGTMNDEKSDRQLMLEVREYCKDIHNLLKRIVSNREQCSLPGPTSSNAAAASQKKLAEEILDLLPLTNMESKKLAEEKVEDETVADSLAAELSLAGGKDLRQTVKRVMERLMSHEMARLHNWCGQNRAKKQDGGPDQVSAKTGFSTSPLVNVIMKAVRMNPQTKSESDANVEERIKTWLRDSRDRNGGRKNRPQ